MTGRELLYIADAHSRGVFSGEGVYARKCQKWIEGRFHSHKALLTHSGTAALEMAALLAGVEPGDEVIMPSFTFPSTANAFVLRGAVPVFVDIRKDTLNLDERLVEPAITPRTRAVCVVHYAGVGCEMDAMMDIARRHGLFLIEDATHAIMAKYKGKPLGCFGQFAAFSFHETKNITCGDGGALIINDPSFVNRAEIIWEKGTDRCRFFRGEISYYTWQDVGSSFLLGEMNAAFLWAQMEHAEEITRRRLLVWQAYHKSLARFENQGLLRRPVVPNACRHNGHLYYVLLPDGGKRCKIIDGLKKKGVHAVFHYIPLHSSPAGLKFGRTPRPLPVTDAVSASILRLPLWAGLNETQIDDVVSAIGAILKKP